MTTNEDRAGDFLSHYGVKGMKWGVRMRDAREAKRSPTPVVTTQKKPGTKVRASGGKNLPASEDAKAAAAARQKARASTTDALSNKELQALVNRLNLEQQYSRLTTSQKQRSGKGQRFVMSLLTDKKYKDQRATAAQLRRDALGVGEAIRKTNLKNIY